MILGMVYHLNESIQIQGGKNGLTNAREKVGEILFWELKEGEFWGRGDCLGGRTGREGERGKERRGLRLM